METSRTPHNVGWPDKLITQAEAFAKACDWPVMVQAGKGTGNINLHCGKCGRSCGQLRRDGIAYNATLDEVLSMVLRHMVMAHDVPLNTREAPGGHGHADSPAVGDGHDGGDRGGPPDRAGGPPDEE
jgi:hypothetical protein